MANFSIEFWHGVLVLMPLTLFGGFLISCAVIYQFCNSCAFITVPAASVRNLEDFDIVCE